MLEDSDIAALRLYRALEVLAADQQQRLPALLGLTFFLGALYLAGLVFVLPETFWFELTVFAALSLGLVFILYLLLRRLEFASRHTHSITGGLVTVIFANLLLRLLLLGESSLIPLLALFIFLTGLVSLTTFWYMELIILSAGGYVLAMLFFPQAEHWLLFGVILAGASAAGLLVQRRILRLLLQSVTVDGLVETAVHPPAVSQNHDLQFQTSMKVGQQLTVTLDLDQLLNRIAEIIVQQYGIYFVAVYLPDVTGLGMDPLARAGRAVDEDDGLLVDQIGLRGQIGRVMAQGKPLRLDELPPHLIFEPGELAPKTRAALLLPLKIGEKVLGVLDLQSDTAGRFNEEDLQAFQFLANQIAIALENARLYSEVKAFNSQLEARVAERTDELRSAYARLERIDKTKSDFITIASHELRTPLTITSINAQMILEDKNLNNNPQYAKWASGIMRGVNRMEDVVQSMLDMAKIDSRSLEFDLSPVKLGPLLQQVISSLREGAEARRIDIKLGDFKKIPAISADINALKKVFYHLINNGIKFTPDGGRVLVDGRVVKTNRLGADEKTAVENIVADSGIGIDSAIQELIFEKFYQTGEVRLHSSGTTRFKGGGSGLGLAIVKGYVEGHQGKVWVDSDGYDEESLPGSVFHVLLPLR